MCEKQPDRVFHTAASNAGAILAAVSAIGFVFAISRETAFFFLLGIDSSQVLDTSDVIRSSALAVLPATPIFLASLLLASSTTVERKRDGTGEVIFVMPDWMYYTLLSTFIIGSLLFFLFGLSPETAVYTIAILIFVLAIQEIGRIAKILQFSRRTYFAASLILLAVVVHFTSGASSAIKIRSGDFGSFPFAQDQQSKELSQNRLWIVRRLTEGRLMVDYEARQIFYVSNDNSFKSTYDLDIEPFRGVLCYAADICQLSGWTRTKMSNP